MENGCNDLSEAKVSERNERAKKLYRYASDIARRIGESTTACHNIADLFSIPFELQRQKLRDSCEKLMFLDPANSGKKALELLWRKVYYEPVSMAKKLRESDTENDCSDLYTHIICGIGHLQHLLTRVQSELKVKCNDLDYTILNEDEETEETTQTSNNEELQFANSAIHMCLIYLGDLSRYQVEMFPFNDPSIAARYYLQAAQIELSSGMPYNQLGNLYMDKNYNLDSVCYYIHCLSCETPFSGAMGNLMKIFEKNNQCYETYQNTETSTQTEHIQNTVANFLSLIELWYFTKNDTNIPQRCSIIAQQLKICMDFEKSPFPKIDENYNEYLQAIEEENTTPSYLNANLINKIVEICLFTLAKMIETDEVTAFACKAFTLALLSQLLQKFLKDLEGMGFKNPARKYNPKFVSGKKYSDEENNISIEEPIDTIQNSIAEDLSSNNHVQLKEITAEKDTDTNQNGEIKNTKKLSKRRRRRRVASSGSSDMSNAETESSGVDTDKSSSDEELSESTYQSENESNSEVSDLDGSDVEDLIEKHNGEIDKTKEDQSNKSYHNDNGTTTTENCFKNVIIKDLDLNENEINLFLLGNNLLCSIKLLQDWILTEKELILSCGDSGEALFQCVVDLLNILTHYFNPKSKETNEIKGSKVLYYAKQVVRNLKLEYKSIPLPEDVNLRGTNICKFDKNAAEWQILDRYKPSVYEENIIRILNFIDFGSQIAKIVPRIRYNRSMKIFYVKKNQPPKVNTKLSHKRNREWHNSKKPQESSEGGLLRRLGKLWLASRVRELERCGPAPAPALLALDTAALHLHLRRVKQLLRARNFILLVPTVVLQELDELKREQSTARDAIRWLETQLKSGSRFLRAQRPGQSRALPLLKYPKKAPPFVQNFIQILEFCNHFIAEDRQSQGGNGEPENFLPGKTTSLLILLVGNEPGGTEEQYKDFSLTGAAQAAGISIQNIGDFYSKWRHTVHKNGKKR